MLDIHVVSNAFSDPNFKDIKKTPNCNVMEEEETNIFHYSIIPGIFTL